MGMNVIQNPSRFGCGYECPTELTEVLCKVLPGIYTPGMVCAYPTEPNLAIMHSGGGKLPELTQNIGLEDNLIRHRGDRQGLGYPGCRASTKNTAESPIFPHQTDKSSASTKERSY